jgi:hypothetical protein
VVVEPRKVSSGLISRSKLVRLGVWRHLDAVHQVMSPSGHIFWLNAMHIQALRKLSVFSISFLAWNVTTPDHYDFWLLPERLEEGMKLSSMADLTGQGTKRRGQPRSLSGLQAYNTSGRQSLTGTFDLSSHVDKIAEGISMLYPSNNDDASVFWKADVPTPPLSQFMDERPTGWHRTISGFEDLDSCCEEDTEAVPHRIREV